MSREYVQLSSLAEVELGDLITLPNGSERTVRTKVLLPRAVGTMSGFVICGELNILLSVPSSNSEPVSVYSPLTYFPPELASARTVFEGAASYWAPHLPSITGAMAEITYRVLEVPGSVDPAVIIYRGVEFIVFMKSSTARPEDMKVLHMPRTDANDYDVVRHSATVETPATAPTPQKRHLPDAVPQKERRKIRQR